MHSFVKCLFRDMSTNFYWNRFIFDRHRAKYKLAQFLLRHRVHYTKRCVIPHSHFTRAVMPYHHLCRFARHRPWNSDASTYQKNLFDVTISCRIFWRNSLPKFNIPVLTFWYIALPNFHVRCPEVVKFSWNFALQPTCQNFRKSNFTLWRCRTCCFVSTPNVACLHLVFIICRQSAIGRPSNAPSFYKHTVIFTVIAAFKTFLLSWWPPYVHMINRGQHMLRSK